MKSRKSLIGAVCGLYMTLVTLTPASAQTITRTRNLGPISLSYEELGEAVTRWSSFISRANPDSSEVSRHRRIGTLTLEGRNTKLELTNNLTPLDIRRAPPTATNAWFWFRSPGDPISEVSVRLSDFEREVEVAGTSPEQVDALTVLIASDLDGHSSHIGGWLHRTVLMGLLIVPAFAFSPLFGRSAPQRLSLRQAVLALLPILGVVLVLPLGLLPGVAIVKRDASFIVRYAPEISMWGLLLGLIGIAFTIWPRAQAPPPQARSKRGRERG